MKPLETLLASAAISVLMAGAALAHTGHGRPGASAGESQDMGAADQGMMPMMQTMMRMHGAMMGPAMPGMGMMNGANPAMPDGVPGMGAMLPGLRADVDGDGSVTPEELRGRLQALLSEHDADGNGALSLDEFAALHAALMRETMVDRFQFLDDDGDGSVSAAEIAKPARLLKQMQAMRGRMMDRAPDRDTGAVPGQSGMMHDN